MATRRPGRNPLPAHFPVDIEVLAPRFPADGDPDGGGEVHPDHQPLYRQAEALRRDRGWALSRATMGEWVERVGVTLRPLYDALVAGILAADYVQMDESGIKVLSEDKPGATHRGWMWLVHDPGTGAVALRYDRSRAARVPTAVLTGFNGTLRTDGYGAYGKALDALRATGAEIRRVGCLAHVRRKFVEARDADPRAEEALAIIQRIYSVEAGCRGQPPDERLDTRGKDLAPLVERFDGRLADHRYAVLPKTPLGGGVGYALDRWPAVAAAAMADGRIEVDNNGIENRVRPLALGRHEEMGRRGPASESLFAGDHGAALNSAVLYGLLLSCEAAGVNPRAWLNDTLERILQHPVNRIAELLPSHHASAVQDVVG